MTKNIFYCSGKIIYRLRWYIIAFWLLLLLISTPFAPKLMEPFKSIGFLDPQSESAKADKILNEKIGYGYNQFIIIYKSDTLRTTDPEFMREIKTSLEKLKKFPIKHQIVYPDSNNKKQISDDKHTAYAVVLFKGNQEADNKVLKQFKSLIRSPAKLDMQIGGEPIFLEDTKQQTQRDLYKAEYIATPIAIVTMLIVFGSVVAAILPVLLGGISAFGILVILCCIGNQVSLSVFTLNIALLLGLCLTLDYTLFIISRFRDELKSGHNTSDAIAITQATAGKAIFFSGLAVFASLSALLLFPITILYSVGIGGLIAVAVSVIIAIVLLPAILSVLHRHINFLSIRLFKAKNPKADSYWKKLATHVVQKPLLYFFTILFLLLFLAYPLTHIKLGISDFRILPKNLESRETFDAFAAAFGENQLTPIMVLVKSPHGKILTKKNIAYLYDYTQKLKKDHRVKEVTSLVSTTPKLTKEQYQTLYTQGESQWSPDLKKLLKLTTNGDTTVITVISKYKSDAPKTKELIKHIRKISAGDKLKTSVTGSPVNVVDVLTSITKIFPYAFLWIVIFTYFILLILLRSLFLPLKAVVMTILSLCASYGVLVFVIQHGYFHHLLDFEAQGMIDISLMIIIFCALFGISMDYEVFLLTRIRENYVQTGDNVKSIIFGIDQSSKIITSAAIIVVLLCFSFMFADVLIVKAFGLGVAVAVFVDAFLIRTIFVPATMTLFKNWNWYLPKWLNAILPKIDMPKRDLPVTQTLIPKSSRSSSKKLK